MAAADSSPGMTARATGRGRPRSAARDAAILDAAIELLIELGPDAASVEAIARRAGVAKLTVYRRWKSKEELLITAIDHVRTPGPEPFPPDATIDDVVPAIAGQLSQQRYRDLMARVIGSTVDRPDLVQAYADRHLQPRLDALQGVAQRAIDAGDFPAGSDAATIRDALFGSVVLALYPPVPTEDEIEHRLRLLLEQLGHRSAASSPGASSGTVA
ncbi:TetR/AcrR family transcriptional regulator [Brachybacterium hainanense]|uniref:TetR/AcrR family transcriptional regulator n=1 Tax=Brachybacterium hainanense TaxID=1541174 RepID=A0ABV6RDT9_9MICO